MLYSILIAKQIYLNREWLRKKDLTHHLQAGE